MKPFAATAKVAPTGDTGNARRCAWEQDPGT